MDNKNINALSDEELNGVYGGIEDIGGIVRPFAFPF